MPPTLRPPAAAIALAAALAAPVSGHAMGHDEGVTIVFALNLQDMSSERAALSELQPVIDFVRASDGYIEDVVLRGEEGSTSDFLHVTRWEAVADWEAMFESAEFLAILTGMMPGFAPSAAQVWRPVR